MEALRGHVPAAGAVAPPGELRFQKLFAASHAEFHDREHAEKERGANYARSWLAANALRSDDRALAGLLAKVLGGLKSGGRTATESIDERAAEAIEKHSRAEISRFLRGS